MAQYCLVVSTGVKQNSCDTFAILDPDSGGALTFRAKLSANGLEPVSHWGARTYLEPATHNALTNMTTTEFKAYVDGVATLRGRQPIGSITAFKNNVQISEADANFNAFISSLGLLRIAEPI